MANIGHTLAHTHTHLATGLICHLSQFSGFTVSPFDSHQRHCHTAGVCVVGGGETMFDELGCSSNVCVCVCVGVCVHPPLLQGQCPHVLIEGLSLPLLLSRLQVCTEDGPSQHAHSGHTHLTHSPSRLPTPLLARPSVQNITWVNTRS